MIGVSHDWVEATGEPSTVAGRQGGGQGVARQWHLHILGAAHTGLTLLPAALQGSLQPLDGLHQSLLGPLHALLTHPLRRKHMPLAS